MLGGLIAVIHNAVRDGCFARLCGMRWAFSHSQCFLALPMLSRTPNAFSHTQQKARRLTRARCVAGGGRGFANKKNRHTAYFFTYLKLSYALFSVSILLLSSTLASCSSNTLLICFGIKSLYAFMPVPAGISLPIITFSLIPVK